MMKLKNKKILNFEFLVKKHWFWIFFFLILFAHIFFRFYQMEARNPFGWDQVDNAWAAKNMIVDHQWPLRGMQAKLNAGFYIGPFYYNLVAPVYYLTNLDPSASGIMAGLTSLFTFGVFFFLTKKLFSAKVALLTVFFYSFSAYIIDQDRIQWPVNLIAPVSLIIFYSLYQVTKKRLDYLFLMAAAIGFSFHLNFTSIFFPIIVLGALPFFPWSKKFLKHALISLPIFLVWLIPTFLAELRGQNEATFNLVKYLQTYYHGFHLRRVIQIAGDAFIQFEGILIERLDAMKMIKWIKYLFLPLFILIYSFPKPSREKIAFCYLLGLWFFIPWFVFSLYSGEITPYYFSLTRPLVIMMVAYLFVKLFEIKNIVPKILVIGFLVYYALANTQNFLKADNLELGYQKQVILRRIEKGEKIGFKEGSSESYLYYFYTEWKK